MEQALDKQNTEREKGIYRVTVMGSIVNFLLLVFKFFAAFFGHSAAMLADAVHSLSDFVTDIIVILFVRISAKPRLRARKVRDIGYGYYRYSVAVCGIWHSLERCIVYLSFLAGRFFAGTGYSGAGSGVDIYCFKGSSLSLYSI